MASSSLLRYCIAVTRPYRYGNIYIKFLMSGTTFIEKNNFINKFRSYCRLVESLKEFIFWREGQFENGWQDECLVQVEVSGSMVQSDLARIFTTCHACQAWVDVFLCTQIQTNYYSCVVMWLPFTRLSEKVTPKPAPRQKIANLLNTAHI